ncbi:hypothetical protein HY504_01050 [Candidatus Wolfebacteria bacterium]|nr:hypothetical protein [Candidatus Wolfebacteria bacterium]
MITITIPKKLIKEDDLVIMPRKEYEAFLRLLKRSKGKSYSQLDMDLDEAIAEYRAGKFFGPFDTAKAGIAFLKSRKTSRKINGK